MKPTIQLGARLPFIQMTEVYFVDIDTGEIGSTIIKAWPGDLQDEHAIRTYINEVIFDEANERQVNIRLATADELVKYLSFGPGNMQLDLVNTYAFYPERGAEIIRPSCQAIIDHAENELEQKNTLIEIPKKEEKPKIDLSLLVH